MRIDAYNAINQIYNTSGVKKTSTVSKAVTSEQYQVSRAGKDYQVAKAAVAQASDVREDVVADIKARMDAGTYSVSAMDFANKIVDNYNVGLTL